MKSSKTKNHASYLSALELANKSLALRREFVFRALSTLALLVVIVLLPDRNSDTSPSLFCVYLIACHPKCFHTPWGFLPYTLGNLGDRSDILSLPVLGFHADTGRGWGHGGCAPSSYRDSYSPWRERYLFICCPIFVRGGRFILLVLDLAVIL